MENKLRSVVELPLSEVWNEQGPVSAARLRHLTREDLRQLLQAGAVCFIIANVGHLLRWIPDDEGHAFWKLEVRPHLVAEPDRPFDIYSFPEGYCYIASEWRAPNEVHAIVLLEQRH